MFLIHLKIAWRNLISDVGYSILNILGLTVGLTVVLFIGLWANDEFQYDSYVKDNDRIVQVWQTHDFQGKKSTFPAIPIPLEKELRNNYGAYFENLSLASWPMDVYLKHEETNLNTVGMYIQPDGPFILGTEVVKGNSDGLRDDKHSIIISESLSEKLFGDKDPLGLLVKINARTPLKVTAVFKDFPSNSMAHRHKINFFTSWDYYVSSEKWLQDSKDEWHNNSFQLFGKIADNTSVEQLNPIIEKAKDKVLKKINDPYNFYSDLFLHPMSRWWLYSGFNNGDPHRVEIVDLFIIIAISVLILACINFMNLSTARSEKRAREVGVKKTLGAYRKQLVLQFFSETFILVLGALVLSIVIVTLLFPLFNELVGKEMVMPWANGIFWLSLLLVLFMVTIAAGSYPALFLSKFQPAHIIKGVFVKGKSQLVRKVLVVFQFVISICLIALTLIVEQQIRYAQEKDVGYLKEGLIQFDGSTKPFWGKQKFHKLKEAFIQSGAVTSVTLASSAATQVNSNRSFMTWKGKPADFQPDFAWFDVKHNYAETLGLEVVAGRNFSEELASDSTAILINQAAVKYTGLENPIGEYIQFDENSKTKRKHKIVGVVKDVIASSPYIPVKQAIYAVHKWYAGVYLLRLNKVNTVEDNMNRLKTVFKEHLPDVPFDVEFVDDAYEEKFETTKRMLSLLGLASIFTILISCIGLFGLTSFVAEKRAKEISIRKSIGASIFNIWSMLSNDFFKLLGIATLVALPLAYYLGLQFVKRFEERIGISPWIFVFSVCLAFIITIVTISFHGIKAAKADPVKSLKD